MFNQKFIKNQPFISKFFQAVLLTPVPRLNHAYMFTGSDILAQYYSVIQIALALNCQTKSSECNCISCNWIKQNRHPAVITVSPIDFTFGAEGEYSKSSTVIKIAQARYLRKILTTSSQYHRIVIFSDAEAGKESEDQSKLMWKDYEGLISPPHVDEEERTSWIPKPLTYKVFQSETANALLKTLEEPPANVTFFFLCKDKEDMIDTIVSRCQIMPVLSNYSQTSNLNILEEIMPAFPPQTHKNAIEISEKIIETSKQNSISIDSLLSCLQEYSRLAIRSINTTEDNHEQKIAKLIGFVEKTEQAKLQLINYVNPQAVLDGLFLSLV